MIKMNLEVTNTVFILFKLLFMLPINEIVEVIITSMTFPDHFSIIYNSLILTKFPGYYETFKYKR